MSSSLAAARAENLTNGVNLSHWFWAPYIGDATTAIKQYITQTDVNLIKNLGFDHVRLPVDVSNLMSWNNPSQLNSAMLTHLDSAIGMLQASGLSVIVTPFGDFEQKVVQPQYLQAAKSFWSELAEHLSTFNVEKTFLEVANEPIAGPATWNPIQESLIASIRESAPNNTIITATYLKFGEGVNDWGAVQGLVNSPLSADPNVIYNLHFYEPFLFTHQGAPWGDPLSAQISGVPYIANAQNMATLVAQLQSKFGGSTDYAWVAQWAQDYALNNFDATDLEKLVAPAVQWAANNGVPLLFNEFGVYKDGGVNAADRISYLYDLRMIMEEQGIKWTSWDYGAGFGIVDKTTGAPILDLAQAIALGLDVTATNARAEISGDAGNNTLWGNTGADHITAGAGNDVLRGGKGNDTLFGNSGADKYVFKTGDGKDTVSEIKGDSSHSVVDSIVLEDVTNINNVTFQRAGSHLIINYGQGDEITVFNQFDSINAWRQVEQLELGNGEKYTLNVDGVSIVTKILDAVPAPAPAPAPVPAPAPTPAIDKTFNGTSGRDILKGTDKNDAINGLGGNDSLYGLAGNDLISGGDGNDTFYGGNGDDRIAGDAGNDMFYAEAGNDTLLGGAGNDTLYGGAGADVFSFASQSRTSGVDTVQDFTRGVDKLDLSGNGLNYAIISTMTTDLGADIRITGSGWSITLKGAQTALDAGDFLF